MFLMWLSPSFSPTHVEIPISSLKVSPAFQQLQEYVDKNYTTRAETAVTSLPDGEARYNQLIR